MMRTPPSALPFLLGTLLLTACATTLGAEELTPDKVVVEHQHSLRVEVHASPSPRTMLSPSRITGEELQYAVEDAIGESEVFLPLEGHPADYSLHALVTKLEESGISVDRESIVTIRWSLAKPSGEEVWSKELTTDYTAHIYNTDPDDERILVATREAVKANITRALERISKLELADV